MDELKEVVWVASSKRDLMDFPSDVQKEVGYELYQVQKGEQPLNSKVLRGFGSTAVVEIVENYDTDTYRAVYTVRFADRVYVLYCFQKKSKQGTKTPSQDIDKIKRRLRAAEEMHRSWMAQRKTEQ